MKRNVRKEVEDYFKKKGTYEKYEKDGTLEERIQKGVRMVDMKERYDAWKPIWDEKKTTDDWETTSRKIENYRSFIDTAEDMLGRKLVITTGGSSLNHQLKKGEKDIGALDIGKSQMTDEEYDMLGKLALDFGYRVGDEADHLHVDNTINVQTEKAREDVIKHYEQNPPKDPSKLPSLIEKGTQMAIAHRKKLTKNTDPDKIRIPTKRVFYNIGSKDKGNYNPARAARKQLGTFEKYMQTFVDPKDVIEEDKSSPLQNMQKAGKEPEKEKRDSIRKMKIAKDIDFGIYN